MENRYTYSELVHMTHYLFKKYEEEFERQEDRAIEASLHELERVLTQHSWYKFVILGQFMHLSQHPSMKTQFANQALITLLQDELFPAASLEPGEAQDLLETFAEIIRTLYPSVDSTALYH